MLELEHTNHPIQISFFEVGLCYVAHGDLELALLLPLPPECRDDVCKCVCRHTQPQCWTFFLIFTIISNF